MMHTHAKHTIHKDCIHYGWDNALEPALHIAPGDTIDLQTADASAGQLHAQSTANDLKTLDMQFVNPVTGPIYVDGAQPGDALKVTLHAFRPLVGWGWTANIPGFGLLADQFPEPHLHHWKYDASLAPAMYGPGGRVPLRPFVGTIGTALAAPGIHSIIPPRHVGGNMDVRDLSAGTVLYLPVEVAGGLLSFGDTHAAQGDGEVCGTAIESPIDATISVDLIKDARLRLPRFTTPGQVARQGDTQGYEVTLGIGPDLMQCARTALMEMIDLLSQRFGYQPIDAYMLCSVCADLKINAIVDQPNWVVGMYFPRAVVE